MSYKAIKVDGQKFMYRIEMQRNGEPLVFNVVCAESDSEIDSLVQHYLNFLDSGQTNYPVNQNS